VIGKIVLTMPVAAAKINQSSIVPASEILGPVGLTLYKARFRVILAQLLALLQRNRNEISYRLRLTKNGRNPQPRPWVFPKSEKGILAKSEFSNIAPISH
jgi:hypothetical protein